jgi:hypothetical protein
VVFLVTILFASIVAWFLFMPHLNAAPADIGADEDVLVDHKNRCVQVLRDLELDYSTQKISREDYERTRIGLEEELAGILRKLDARLG